jgi:hypothetical protein
MYFKVYVLPTKTLTKIKIFIQKLERNIEYFTILKVYLENTNTNRLPCLPRQTQRRHEMP